MRSIDGPRAGREDQFVRERFALITPRPATFALLAGALILTLAMGIRQSFGLFLPPMSVDLGVNRETFGLAMAIQNLLWGLAQPVAGMVADRYGAPRVLLAGTAIYTAGLWVMSGSSNAWGLHLGGGLLVGLAMSCTSFAVVLGAIGRAVPAEKRSMALGMASAGGSFGQFVMAPIGQTLIETQGWAGALTTMAVLALLMAPLSLALASRGRVLAATPTAGTASQTLGRAIAEARRHTGFWCLTVEFFVCGFQVVLIAVHLPAYLNDLGLSADVGATALALIGFFNIVGTWLCGALGGRHSKNTCCPAFTR